MGDFEPSFVFETVLPSAAGNDSLTATYDQHQRELYSFALRTCRDAETAEDLVHEAFVRLLIESAAGRTPDNVRAWLFRVIANLAVTRARRANVARRALAFVVIRDTQEGPELKILEHERRSDLEIALSTLPADARTALLLAARGFSGPEIAAAIGRSDSATRTMMCRARMRLREQLASEVVR